MPITPTVVRGPLEAGGDQSVILATWILLTATPDGLEVALPEYADKSWSIGNASGDSFGGTGVCSIQGRNASADTKLTLNKPAPASGAATANAPAVIATIENPLLVAPVLTTVGSAATVTVRMLARRATPLRT